MFRYPKPSELGISNFPKSTKLVPKVKKIDIAESNDNLHVDFKNAYSRSRAKTTLTYKPKISQSLGYVEIDNINNDNT